MTIIASSAAPAAASAVGAFSPFLLMAGSTFLGALSNHKAGDAAAHAARVAAMNAKYAGYFRERGLRRNQAEIQSTIRARAGAAGLDVTQGSPLEAYLESTRETELDILHSRFTTGSEVSADLDAAKIAERTGKMDAISSLISGGAKMLSAKSKATRQYRK